MRFGGILMKCLVLCKLKNAIQGVIYLFNFHRCCGGMSLTIILLIFWLIFLLQLLVYYFDGTLESLSDDHVMISAECRVYHEMTYLCAKLHFCPWNHKNLLNQTLIYCNETKKRNRAPKAQLIPSSLILKNQHLQIGFWIYEKERLGFK